MSEIQLIYVSQISPGFDLCDLESILATAVENNKKHNITGVLTVLNDVFIQVLEGESVKVEQLVAKIEKDKRNFGLIVLQSNPIEHRLFPDWSMGYVDESHYKVRDIGYFQEILSLEETLKKMTDDTSWVADFLRNCVEHYSQRKT
ncbi:hypothetical protein GCM10011332_07800 [Terasakiella brassicae]|uniref:BLUF domain-containing protein n=1 Tax=Terasakiella brassicae TaxID=1634917 RepID=A0A917F8L1_9PROT|nr:BLUF domain-containing protein [Terasakiella brassicae]GGF56781.1 hypothetical protein GCM10011332_07800 [Terasakiella brassicae]